jgi:hypothetical protein
VIWTDFFEGFLAGKTGAEDESLRSKNSAELWRLKTYAPLDTFCIQADNWLSIYHEPCHPMALVPWFIDSGIDYLYVRNIAIELDPGWSMDIPQRINEFCDENSAL